MSSLAGYGVKDPNYILRFSIVVFMSVMAVGAVSFWKSQLLFASEYQELPVTQQQLKVKKENQVIKNKFFKNYNLEE